jgi:integrase/recombinase XerD
MTFLTPVRSLFSWLTDKQFLAFNPASSMDMPRVRQTLPKHILSNKEVEAIIAQVDVTAPLGLRDRALLELTYSTGIRRSELAALKVEDVNLSTGWVFIEQGKGAKDRRIPVGERACLWLKKYLLDQRPYLLGGQCYDAMFVYKNGKPMSADKIYRVIHAFIQSAELGKSGGSHMLRHAMATHMLEGGSDIRHIQKMLGHEQLTSTQIYARVQDNKLKEVHAKTHPAQIKQIGSDDDPQP